MYHVYLENKRGGAVVLRLVRSTPDRAVRGHMFCVLGQDTTLALPLSTQEYKYVSTGRGGGG